MSKSQRSTLDEVDDLDRHSRKGFGDPPFETDTGGVAKGRRVPQADPSATIEQSGGDGGDKFRVGNGMARAAGANQIRFEQHLPSMQTGFPEK